MNRKLLALLIVFPILSCENSKINSLEKRIVELETLNSDLEKKIAKADYYKVTASQINLFPDNVSVRVGEQIKVRGKFFENNSLPKYNLYETDSTFSKSSRKILLENITEPNFDVTFTPKSKEQNKMYVVAEFDLNNEKFESPSIVQFVVR
jgi:hypothetical protein